MFVACNENIRQVIYKDKIQQFFAGMCDCPTIFGVMLHNHGNVKKCAVGKHPKSEKLGSTGQAACCARIHSRYFTGGSPSGLRV